MESDGHLMQGDQILTVNREDVRCATQEYVAALLKVNVTNISYKCILSFTIKNVFHIDVVLCYQSCSGPIRLEVGRFKSGPIHSQRRLSHSSQVRACSDNLACVSDHMCVKSLCL